MTHGSEISLDYVFECPLPSGLHARPASHLAEVANQFSSECSLTNLRNGLLANVKSVLGIIAADIRHNDRCALRISGSDQQAARAALERFVEKGLPRCDVPLASISASDGKSLPPRQLRAEHIRFLFGVPVSRGIGRGKIVVVNRRTRHDNLGAEAVNDNKRELVRIEEALIAVRHRISEKLKYSANLTGSAVLQADLAMAGDVFLVQQLKEQVLKGKSAAQSIVHVSEFFIDLLRNSENEYIQQRAADIEEICSQLLEEVSPSSSDTGPVELREPSVLVAEMLGPQQLLELDRRWLQAIVLEHSGATSHAAILAQSLGIPAVAGVRNARLALTTGREVVVDANRGFVVPQITPDVQRFYDREGQTLARRQVASARGAAKRVITADGVALEIAANVSSGEELASAFDQGADGVGLFRTEMIFLGREQPPSEEEQTAIYSSAARSSDGRSLIIRTFDIGGDKLVPYLNLAREENPFLGYRGVRIYADHQELLQTQLRAILRASAEGCVQVMAPMITSVEEILLFKAAIGQAKQDLSRRGLSFDKNIKVGMMVEVPAVAFMASRFCDEVDFFSIGTNDLSQYFFAADRSSPKVASLFSICHPAFLRFLVQMVEEIHKAKKWVGICGEMASDPRYLPLMIGLGLDEISVRASQIGQLKYELQKLRATDCDALLKHATVCNTAAEVEMVLAKTHTHQLEPLLSEELVLLNSSSTSKEEVIQEMVDLFYISDRTQDRHQLEEALWAREAVYSTGLGYGFATPHCKTEAITCDTICVLRLNDPINWDSVDGERVRMVVLLAMRNSEIANRHMQVFSRLARKLMNEDFRHHLLAAETAEQVTAYLAQQLEISL